ncbi:MAG TPA: GNAT family N-acetyltransferase [Terriglobales bacterium]|nr:GNAT family N-acetyltransferase [Terriglobales bacterium]
MAITIDEMTFDDWPAVRRIFAEGIATGDATFETEIPEWQQWDASHLPTCRLVARERQQVWGWAALSPVSQRKVYAGVAEVSIYVAAEARGRGVGRLLLQALIAKSEEHGLWTLQAGIFPENASSIALHRACGFREVGRRQRIGKLGNRWRDVLLLERSSARVG